MTTDTEGEQEHNVQRELRTIRRTLTALWLAALFALVWATALSVQMSNLHADLVAQRSHMGQIS